MTVYTSCSDGYDAANNNSESNFIVGCTRRVLEGNGDPILTDDIQRLMNVSDANIDLLADCANKITYKFNGTHVDVEQLYNIKKNGCSEDCTFCGQSAFFDTGIDTYQLPPAQEIVTAAMNAKAQGAESYCLVAAWRQPSVTDFKKVCDVIQQINNDVGISVECSLGFLTDTQAKQLKILGVKRYNHNLETARSKFPEICSTHTYQDRVDTLNIARSAGLELCTGGILGIGETRKQRLELVYDLVRLCPEEITLNLLVPVPGTPLELQTPLSSQEIVRVFAVLRFALPKSIIKVSGGREVNTNDSGKKLLQSGANGIITGGYLTTGGNEPKQDREMIQSLSKA